MPKGDPGRIPVATRLAGCFAITLGAFGVFAGLSGAATYIPFQSADVLAPGQAYVLTGIAATGAIVSAIGIFAGWGLLRGRHWAAWTEVGVAAGCVLIVTALAVAMPSSSPSPVPGGVGVWAFVPVVAAAYGVVLVLMAMGGSPERRKAPRDLTT